MQSINLRDEVQKRMAIEWPQFAARHPHLAAAIDQSVLVDLASRSIADDPEYAQAMANAHAAEAAAQALSALIQRTIRRVLGQ